MEQQELMTEIKKAVTESFEQRRANAGWSGSHGDNGAAKAERELNFWLDGIEFARTGETQVYQEIVQQLKNDRDPEYHEYQRLKKKFEK